MFFGVSSKQDHNTINSFKHNHTFFVVLPSGLACPPSSLTSSSKMVSPSTPSSPPPLMARSVAFTAGLINCFCTCTHQTGLAAAFLPSSTTSSSRTAFPSTPASPPPSMAWRSTVTCAAPTTSNNSQKKQYHHVLRHFVLCFVLPSTHRFGAAPTNFNSQTVSSHASSHFVVFCTLFNTQVRWRRSFQAVRHHQAGRRPHRHLHRRHL